MTPVDPAAPAPARKSWVPTKKWLATAVTGAAAIVANLIVSGEFGNTEQGMLATLLAGLVAAYLKGNDLTPGGVPRA